MSPENRDRLADAVGVDSEFFSPELYADDAEDIVLWLNRNGYNVIVDFTNSGDHHVSVTGENFPDPDYTGPDWKVGVIELALSVLDRRNDG